MDPSHPVCQAYHNKDEYGNMLAGVIPTEQYDLANEEPATAAATNGGLPSPMCLPHLGVRLTKRKGSGDAEHDDDTEPRPGSTVDAFGFNVSSRVQTGGAWTTRHSRFLYYIALLVKIHGIRVRVEPRNQLNGFIPRTFRPGLTGAEASRILQGAIPDIVYYDPKDGKQRVVELKLHNQNPARYPRLPATGRCAGVHEREQSLYPAMSLE